MDNTQEPWSREDIWQTNMFTKISQCHHAYCVVTETQLNYI